MADISTVPPGFALAGIRHVPMIAAVPGRRESFLPRGSPAMTSTKNLTIAVLALAVFSLGLVVVWQRDTLAQIQTRQNFRNTGEPAVAFQSMTRRQGRSMPGQKRIHLAALPAKHVVHFDSETDGEMPSAEAAPDHHDSLLSLVRDPNFIQILARYRESTLDARYAELFRRLDLTTSELTEFKRLLVEKESIALDVVSVVPTSDASPVELDAGVQAAQRDVEDNIRASLGDDRYAMYHAFEQSTAQRATVARLSQRLEYSPEPLQPAQADAVVTALMQHPGAEASAAMPATTLLTGEGTAEVASVFPDSASGWITDDAVQAARSILTPLQLNALHEIQNEQRSAVTANQMILGALSADEQKKLQLLWLMQ